MTDVNINNPQPSNDRSTAAGINMVTVLIVLLIVLVVGWYLMAGPGRGALGRPGIDVNINPPAQQAPSSNQNAPAAPQQQAPAQQAPAQQPAPPKGP